MNVYIYRLRRQVEVNKICRHLFRLKQSGVCSHHSLVEIRLLHVAPVNKEILRTALLRRFRLTHEPEDIAYLSIYLYINQLLAELLARIVLEYMLYAHLVGAGEEVEQHLVV